MEAKFKKKRYRILKLDYQDEKDVWLKSSYTLRKLIGILGILLPLLLPVLLYFTDDFKELLPSISHYYYTKSGPLLISIMSLLAVFFIVYKGNNLIDFITSSIAGIAALFVILLPTANLNQESLFSVIIVTVLPENGLRENIHYIAAAIFLLSLAYMSLARFTITSEGYENVMPSIRLRHKLYKLLGIIMILSMLVIALGSDYCKTFVPQSFRIFYETHHLTFWLEAIAVECFGISWLVKGGEYKLKTI